MQYRKVLVVLLIFQCNKELDVYTRSNYMFY